MPELSNQNAQKAQNAQNKKRNDFKRKKFNRNNKHKSVVGEGYIPSGDENALNIPITQLDLKPQTVEILSKGGIKKCYDLAIRYEREMFKIQNLGRKHCNEIAEKLKALGLGYRPEIVVKNENKGKNFNRNQQNIQIKKEGLEKDKRQKNEHSVKDKGLRNGGLGFRVKPKFIPDAMPAKEPESLVKFSRNKKWGFMDRKGMEITAPEYDEVFPFKEGFACVEKGGFFGYISTDGKPVTDFIYDSALSFSEGYACVTKDDKSGYIDSEGKVALPLEYEGLTPLYEGRAKVKQDGKWYNLNLTDGKFIIS